MRTNSLQKEKHSFLGQQYIEKLLHLIKHLVYHQSWPICVTAVDQKGLEIQELKFKRQNWRKEFVSLRRNKQAKTILTKTFTKKHLLKYAYENTLTKILSKSLNC